jgi:hypothetical protein
MATRPTRSASVRGRGCRRRRSQSTTVVNDRTYWAARGRGRLVRRATPSGVGRADARARPSSSRASPPTAGARGVLRRMVEAFLSRGQCIRGVAPRRSTSACSRTAGSMGTGSSASRLGRRGRHAHRRGGRRPRERRRGRPVDIDRPEVVASNGRIHDEMRAVLEPLLSFSSRRQVSRPAPHVEGLTGSPGPTAISVSWRMRLFVRWAPSSAHARASRYRKRQSPGLRVRR